MQGRVAELERLYDAERAGPGFAQIVAEVGVTDDSALADLIEADGRARLRRRLPVDLDRYLDAVPGLAGRPDPLDAAIDMALRALASSGRPDREAVESLVTRHPNLEAEVREAAALSNVIWSTDRLRADLHPPRVRELPGDFGPVMPDARYRYLLQQLLGEGAFGQVYLAVDRQLSESDHAAMVSIKILGPRSDDGAFARRRFVEEATKARRIDHPHVVRVLDRGVSDEGEDFIVHEYIDGGDLARWSRQRGRPLPPRLAARLVAQIARGVHAAHMAGLVHCDLKPGNIVMTGEGEPKIADFGIAIRIAESEVGGVTGSGLPPLGNLAFISPEQFRMEGGALTFPSDIFALGGILYWLLTDTLPNGDSAEAIGRTHDPRAGRTLAPAPAETRPGIDDDLDAICRRAMEGRPEDRFPSASALADALEAWLAHEPQSWRRPSLLRRGRLWVRRKPALAAVLGVVALLAIGAAVALQQAALTRTRLKAETAAREEAATNLAGFAGKMRALKRKGLATQVLPGIWMMEWAVGPTILRDHIDWAELWDIRTEAIGEVIRTRRARFGDDFQTLMWESQRAFWQITLGEHTAAGDALVALRVAWADRLGPDDPWLAVIDAMHACAAAADADTPAAWRSSRDTLEEDRLWLRVEHPGSPLHRMVLDHLLALYGDDRLDDAAGVRSVQAEIDDLWG